MTDRLVDLTGTAPRSFDAFANHGAVFASFPRDRQITGGGLGVLWNFRRWLSFNGDVAHAFTKVFPGQDSWRVDFRAAVHWE